MAEGLNDLEELLPQPFQPELIPEQLRPQPSQQPKLIPEVWSGFPVPKPTPPKKAKTAVKSEEGAAPAKKAKTAVKFEEGAEETS